MAGSALPHPPYDTKSGGPSRQVSKQAHFPPWAPPGTASSPDAQSAPEDPIEVMTTEEKIKLLKKFRESLLNAVVGCLFEINESNEYYIKK